MIVSPCHAERGKNGPSVSDLEVAIKGYIPAPGIRESFTINFSESKIQLMLIVILVLCFIAETCTYLTANINFC